jgi:hypothetical protein
MAHDIRGLPLHRHIWYVLSLFSGLFGTNVGPLQRPLLRHTTLDFRP